MIKLWGRKSDLGGGMFVSRILPDRQKRMVGPFCFLDHMGPVVIQPHQETDVRPHPHIGLSTLTYLFQGRALHRDSLGTEALIEPGDVNWMTAGRGISHSERSIPEDKLKARTMEGLQLWVALPEDLEDCDPQFQHYDVTSIPFLETSESKITVVVGDEFGLSSPVKATSPLTLIIIESKQDMKFSFNHERFELGFYVAQGNATCANEGLETNQMLIFENGTIPEIQIKAQSKIVILGGEPFTHERHIWWNLVSTSKEKIESAKKKWSEGTFPMVPGETEFIPLPKI